jgi:hypothetical protein
MTPQDARHVPLTRAQRLAQDAAEAAEVRAYQTHPEELDNLPEPSQVTAAEIYARIDMISELGTSLSSAQPERLNKLYDTIGRNCATRRTSNASTSQRLCV